MNSTLENHSGVTESLQASWRHLKDVFLASTPSAAWQSFKKLVEVLPVWSLVVVGVLLAAFVLNKSVIVIAFSVVAVLLAMHHTVKHAVLAALDERERER
jgi:hypothetical protein